MTSRVDSGFGSTDAGPRPDAGTLPGFDAGSFPGFDAGTFPRFDAGPGRRDAGRPDAGPPRRDAGRLDAGGTLPFPDGGIIGAPCITDTDCTGGRCCPIAVGLPIGFCMDVAVCPPPM